MENELELTNEQIREIRRRRDICSLVINLKRGADDLPELSEELLALARKAIALAPEEAREHFFEIIA